MTDTTHTPDTETPDAPATAEGGSHAVLRARLREQAALLSEATSALDARRRSVFGGTELAMLGPVRARTESLAVVRDVVAVGEALLVGANAALHLRAPTVADVFGVYRLRVDDAGLTLDHAPAHTEGGELTLLDDPAFVRDFDELHRYFAKARLVALRRTGAGHLLAVFQVGDAVDDVRVFHWSVAADGAVTYLGDRGERFFTAPPRHDFEWVSTTRDDHVHGRHGHVNIDGALFVETVGGDLTVKLEDDTEDGLGVYREPVDHPDQTLDDASISWAKVGGLYLLKILPYRERDARYFVFDTRTHAVTRVDAIGEACVRLPEDHGVVFPGGYYLQSGEAKLFAAGGAPADGDDHAGLELTRVLRAPNGEDVLYVFHRKADGRYLLLPYNLIEKAVLPPIRCHGFATLDDGSMLVARADAEPSRVHPMEVWRTPFTSAEHADRSAPAATGAVARIGNAALVRGISEAHTIGRLALREHHTRSAVEDLVRTCARALDAHHWLDDPEVGALGNAIRALRQTAERTLDELEKLNATRARARREVEAVTEAQAALLRAARAAESLDARMVSLAALRAHRGRLLTLREARGVETEAVDALERETAEGFDALALATVRGLLDDGALAPLDARVDQLERDVDAGDGVSALGETTSAIDAVGEQLDVLAEVVSGLAIDDAPARASALSRIGEVYARLNRVRAKAAGRRRDALRREGRADLGAQIALISQTVGAAMARATEPDDCDAALARTLVSLEALEARWGEVEELALAVAEERESIQSAFVARKEELREARQRRGDHLVTAATRILEGVDRRARAFEDEASLRAWLASDAMVHKLGELAARLTELGDPVRGQELEGRLRSVERDALRLLRDRRELFDADGALRLGAHRFAVQSHPFDLTLVPHEGGLAFHLTGTDYRAPVVDARLDETEAVRAMSVPSEDDDVYRAEYLAATMLLADDERPLLLAARAEGRLTELVRERAEARYQEGYEAGVHDRDAALLLDALLSLSSEAGLLRHRPEARALAAVFWAFDRDGQARLAALGASLGRLSRRDDAGALAGRAERDALVADLGARIARFALDQALDAPDAVASEAARFLADELTSATRGPSPSFTTSAAAQQMVDALRAELRAQGLLDALEAELAGDLLSVGDRSSIARAWLRASTARGPELQEAAAILITEGRVERRVHAATTELRVEGLLGAHHRIEGGAMTVRLDDTLARVGAFACSRVPAFERYRALRRELLSEERRRLKIDALTPAPLRSFVRSQLLDRVYLPRIGENLATQIGTANDARADRQGLLLLISPPGYGKTTLMEYVASQLGLIFVKVDGPALGERVTSLDPAEAPNATARQELEKIGLALEMGNNVMLYLDDIQHTSPEFLSRFLSLCDAQRRIEGVFRGEAKTYDLRGKRFCVVMAGNPYTGRGEAFRVPDMLANRADTHNLGDLATAERGAFLRSYVENAMTSNPTLSAIAARSLEDARRLLRIAEGERIDSEGIDGAGIDGAATHGADFDHAWSSDETEDALAVLRMLFRVRDTLSLVNAAYIRSASTADAHRDEPAFLLQGSYRDMNAIAARVMPAMNDEELERLLDAHYRGEAQTLTSAAEENLLALGALRGRLTPEERARWEAVRATHRRARHLGGADDDPVVRVTRTLASLGEQLETIRAAIRDAADRLVPESDYELE